MTSSISSVPAGRSKVCNVAFNARSGLCKRAAAGDCAWRQRNIGLSIQSDALTTTFRLIDMKPMRLLATSI